MKEREYGETLFINESNLCEWHVGEVGYVPTNKGICMIDCVGFQKVFFHISSGAMVLVTTIVVALSIVPSLTLTFFLQQNLLSLICLKIGI